MSWRLLAILALLTAGLAGCLTQPTLPTDDGTLGVAGLLKAGPALWNDPQNTPHPKWGWATLANPAAGQVPKWWMPINATELPAPITGIEQLVNVGGNVTTGGGIALFGSIAVVPGDGEFVHFVDISNPLQPRLVGQADSPDSRGAAIVAFPDGRLVTAVSTSAGFNVIDFTDPTHPVVLNQTTVPVNGGHKLGIVPGTPILYNAGSMGGDPGVRTPATDVPHPLYGPGECNADISRCVGYTEIYNLTDPAHPRLVQNFQNGLSCHHIFFWNAPDGSRQRAICAGIQYTQLWDVADPEDPKVLVSLPVHAGKPGTPSAMASIEAFSHSAGINARGDILYVGDEAGGGSTPPGCVASVNVPGLGAVSVPVGATWFYDIRDETDPKLLGYYSPGAGSNTYVNGQPRMPTPGDLDGGNVHSMSCTTHHGRIVPDREGRDLLAMSYYGNGVILLDFTGIQAGTLPKVVGQFAQDSNTWETAYYGGYLFTGDLARGMDVIGFK